MSSRITDKFTCESDSKAVKTPRIAAQLLEDALGQPVQIRTGVGFRLAIHEWNQVTGGRSDVD